LPRLSQPKKNGGEEVGKNGMTGTSVCHDHDELHLVNQNPLPNGPVGAAVDHFAALWPIRGYLSYSSFTSTVDGYTLVPFSENPNIYGMLTRTNKPTYHSLK
jgi:hypothetical protein